MDLLCHTLQFTTLQIEMGAKMSGLIRCVAHNNYCWRQLMILFVFIPVDHNGFRGKSAMVYSLSNDVKKRPAEMLTDKAEM